MQTFSGKVISTKGTQTAVVEVRRKYKHPVYNKFMTVTKKYHVHDISGVVEGDEVKFVPCKPISKTKRWKIVEANGKTVAAAKSEASEKKVATKTTKKAEAKPKKAIKKTTKKATEAKKTTKKKSTK